MGEGPHGDALYGTCFPPVSPIIPFLKFLGFLNPSFKKGFGRRACRTPGGTLFYSMFLSRISINSYRGRQMPSPKRFYSTEMTKS